MSFGLSTAPAIYISARHGDCSSRYESRHLPLLPRRCGVVWGSTLNEHNNRLRAVLSRFRKHNLRAKLSKCTFGATKVSFLGHVISANGVSPDPDKISAVKNIESPRNIKDVRSFLVIVGYYRKFIPKFASMAAPLTNLTRKEVSQKSFQ